LDCDFKILIVYYDIIAVRGFVKNSRQISPDFLGILKIFETDG